MKRRRKQSFLGLVAARITNTVFDYHRVGHDRRFMTFLPDGLIGLGAAGCEVWWRLKNGKGEAVLEILSQDQVTCRLTEGRDGVWRGRWLYFERMPTELSPVPNRATKRSSGRAGGERLPQSIFIISLPRSLSTMVYQTVRKTVGLQEPIWTSDGEILNVDRLALSNGRKVEPKGKFYTKGFEPGLFYSATEFLDQLVLPCGFAYKDVVQPFVVAEWIVRRGIPAIRIKRDIAEVAYSMLKQGWHYPRRLFEKEEDPETALVRGLIVADRVLDTVPAVCIEFEQLIVDEWVLNRCLRSLYPTKSIDKCSLIDENFKAIRQKVLERRNTRLYRRLANLAVKWNNENDQPFNPAPFPHVKIS